ncbi:hypothetical protein NSA56_01700 [Oceanobacillus caeni]|uniref:hypothetical protein n=1 Tax=Oceanobacillus caeni TaxID=405946 RepID=UPI002149B220|nr:hypothetical protein [Oceanobacillus caeni]MCR1833110.1 hypothetical protein [Oceanobacillus caeni]
MNFTKLNLYFSDCKADITMENQDDDTIVLSVSEMQVNKEKTTENHEVIEPYTTSEICLGIDEAKSLLAALKFIIPKE